MSTLVGHTNEASRETFGALTTDTATQKFSEDMPVLATPAAAAPRPGIALAASGVGSAAEEAADA